jgi:hypothetical protein
MAWIFVLRITIVFLALYFLQKFLVLKNDKKLPLPPGPKPKFLVGNLVDLPKAGEQEWIHWLKHKDLYGA